MLPVDLKIEPLESIRKVSRFIFLSPNRDAAAFCPYELRYTEKRSSLSRPSAIILSKTGVVPEAARCGYARPRIPSAVMYCMTIASVWLRPKNWLVRASSPTWQEKMELGITIAYYCGVTG